MVTPVGVLDRCQGGRPRAALLWLFLYDKVWSLSQRLRNCHTTGRAFETIVYVLELFIVCDDVFASWQ